MRELPLPLWPWLFPLTYAAHIAEEYGGGFYLWLSRVAGVPLSRADFIALNAVAFVVMTAVVIAAVWRPETRWLMAALGTVVLVNGSVHVIASAATRTYSPGVVTGVLLWIPLGAFTLRRAAGDLSRRRLIAGIVVGLAMHAIVSALALAG